MAQVAGWATDVTALKIGAAYQNLPELRGFWGFGSINESGNALDLSGQGRTLTNNGSVPRAILPSGLPYCTFNGSSQYWSRADEAGLDITGALTVGGWIYPGALGTVNQEGVIGKHLETGNQRSYALFLNNGTGNAKFQISVNGGFGAGNASEVNSDALQINTWTFLVGRFTPATEVACFTNNVKTINAGGVVASCFNCTAAFEIGRRNLAATFFNGRSALCFLCAAALPDDLIYQLYEMGKSLFG